MARWRHGRRLLTLAQERDYDSLSPSQLYPLRNAVPGTGDFRALAPTLSI